MRHNRPADQNIAIMSQLGQKRKNLSKTTVVQIKLFDENPTYGEIRPTYGEIRICRTPAKQHTFSRPRECITYREYTVIIISQNIEGDAELSRLQMTTGIFSGISYLKLENTNN